MGKRRPKIVSHNDAPIDWANVDESNIEWMAPTCTQTVEQAKELIYRTDWKQVVAVGYDQDGDFKVRSSKLSRQATLWLAHLLIEHAMKGNQA